MKKLMVMSLALAVMLTGAVAFAGPRGWGQGMGPGYCGSGDAASNLNLTDEQSAKIGTVRENYLKEITPLRNRMFSLRSEMRLLWNAASPDRDKILAKQKELSNLQAQLDEKGAQYRLDCNAVLTPEQQSKMTAYGSGMARGYGRGRMHGGRW